MTLVYRHQSQKHQTIMKRFFFFFTSLFSLVCPAQIDKHSALENELINNPTSALIQDSFQISLWVLALYTIVIIAAASTIMLIILMRQQRKAADEKMRFFINAAHNIRTPLTLIKAPLEELAEQENLSENGQRNAGTALRNVNALLQLTTNLVNLERIDTYSDSLYISEYELNTYIAETVDAFRPHADVKHINLTSQSDFRYLNVWIDKDKMDAILKNLLSNALKYTPEGGKVDISAHETDDTWSIAVTDTGIGIPASEQKQLFKKHFRGRNAVNSQVTGSGIGLLLVWKLVRLHKGKLKLNSTEGSGTCVKITFPKRKEAFDKAVQCPNAKHTQMVYSTAGVPVNVPAPSLTHKSNESQPSDGSTRQKILIVEDNSELREYLRGSLSEQYDTRVCSNGKEALTFAGEYLPDLIISDIMIPGLKGDELCHALKNDINTSHIPFILLTALNTDRNIIEGLQSGADEYLVKPFNIGILRASIANLLANRKLLRQKFANLELNEDKNGTDCINCSTDLDWRFVATVKKEVEANMEQPNFNVDALCNLMNMSRTSFYNKIKALTDQAPADYIRLIRLNHAAQLLKEQRYSITEISEKTGFSDAKYFREVFKKHFNMSPSQYAKTTQQG